MSEQPLNVDNVRIDKDADLIFCSVGLYKFFLAHGQRGMEAKQVYDHLMFTARLQETAQVWATNTYIKQGLQTIGNKKLKEAKAFLAEHGLISYIFQKDAGGKVTQVFTKVKIGAATSGSVIGTADQPPPKTTGSVSTRVDSDTCGYEHQMLKTSNVKKTSSGTADSDAGAAAASAEPPTEIQSNGKEEVSVPFSDSAMTTDTTTDDIPILDTIVRKLVDDLNAATGWHINAPSARSVLLALHADGLLDADYLEFVAEQPRVQNAAHFMQAVKSGDYVEKFEAEQHKYRSLTDDNHVRCFCGACFVELFDGGACTTHSEAPVLRWPELQTAVVALRGDAAWAEKVAELEAAKRERRLEERRKQSEAESRMTWEELSQVGMSKLTPAGEKRLAELRQAENAELEAKLAGRTWAQYMRDQKAKQGSAEVQT